ncbi:putative secreted protein (Por secretion system target) [Jejuia pallidilutea]|uniref:Putative secreted protein (Por secretion system target) n=1 Tax=Jejuia pallidilutea TaxID=504487 RepID=A0A362X0I8_9FLAO|nr:T9SS type A sorting domain-containing protein [Jejuia pallidilutea]PQV46572.1 putative secreted protein (Por secretion system target) [Jejuia pallidilutea]
MKGKLIKNIGLLLLAIWVIPTLHGQSATKNKGYKIIRSNVGVGGSSKTFQTTKGTYTVSQSIGQSSVIGTSVNNGYYLRQGFQQPHKPITVTKSAFSSLKAIVYPNPFDYDIQISFSESVSKDIKIEVYDVLGKLVYVKKFSPSKKLRIDLTKLSTGAYTLKAISNGKLFNSKLIKI